MGSLAQIHVTDGRDPRPYVPIWAGRCRPVMVSRTVVLWEKQDSHKGDRKRLYTALRHHLGDCCALYPSSYVDIAPSFVFSSVTYSEILRVVAVYEARVRWHVADQFCEAVGCRFVHDLDSLSERDCRR
jgi:hypothetical protein